MTGLTDVVDTVTTNGLAEVSALMATPLGLIISFGVAITLLGVVIGVIKRFI